MRSLQSSASHSHRFKDASIQGRPLQHLHLYKWGRTNCWNLTCSSQLHSAAHQNLGPARYGYGVGVGPLIYTLLQDWCCLSAALSNFGFTTGNSAAHAAGACLTADPRGALLRRRSSCAYRGPESYRGGDRRCCNAAVGWSTAHSDSERRLQGRLWRLSAKVTWLRTISLFGKRARHNCGSQILQ